VHVKMSTKRTFRIITTAAMVFVGLGCPNPNTYTTPRTAATGHITNSVAVEAWGFSVPASGATGALRGTLPTLPTYSLRVGVSESVEIGARAANLTAAGLDVKWNPIRSRYLDLAIDPGGQVFQFGASSDSGSTSSSGSFTVAYFHAPILVGVNLARQISLVLSPGITYGIASASLTAGSGQSDASTTTGLMGRFGVGIDFRISPGFALHPEITFLRTLDTNPTLLYTAGLGFNFGGLPSFDDAGANASPPPALGVAPSGPQPSELQ
jgi:hypothetical protein